MSDKERRQQVAELKPEIQFNEKEMGKLDHLIGKIERKSHELLKYGKQDNVDLFAMQFNAIAQEFRAVMREGVIVYE